MNLQPPTQGILPTPPLRAPTSKFYIAGWLQEGRFLPFDGASDTILRDLIEFIDREDENTSIAFLEIDLRAGSARDATFDAAELLAEALMAQYPDQEALMDIGYDDPRKLFLQRLGEWDALEEVVSEPPYDPIKEHALGAAQLGVGARSQ